MTNNHCPEQIRTMIPAEIQKNLRELAEQISERVYEKLEEMSFDCIVGMPEDWSDCAHCERRTLNAQEKALEILEKELLSLIRNTGVF